MHDVRRVTRPRPGAGSGKVDARSERWREHRKKVRAEIVDAAFRAIDKRGPEVSLREIANKLGIGYGTVRMRLAASERKTPAPRGAQKA